MVAVTVCGDGRPLGEVPEEQGMRSMGRYALLVEGAWREEM